MSNEKIAPTLENVLPNMKQFISEKGKDGRLGLMGGLPCPWCRSEMINIRPSYLATCSKDPSHQVTWLPWGG